MKTFLLPLITLIVVMLYIYVINKSRKTRQRSSLPLNGIISDYLGPATRFRFDQKGTKTIIYIRLIIYCLMLLSMFMIHFWEIGLAGWGALLVIILLIYLASSALINFNKIKKLDEDEMSALKKTFLEEKQNKKIK